MKKMPLFLGAAAAALTLASCEKELESINGSPQSATAASVLARPDLLAAGAWHQTGLLVSVVDKEKQIATSDQFAQAKPTVLVKSAVYQADGTYSLLRGARWDGQPAQPVSGTWRLNAAADSLVVTHPDYTQRMAVTELTEGSLHLAYTEPAADGKVVTTTSVFAH